MIMSMIEHIDILKVDIGIPSCFPGTECPRCPAARPELIQPAGWSLPFILHTGNEQIALQAQYSSNMFEYVAGW